MSVALPPSARDFLIYQRLTIDAASTRTVATEVGLSQTRVRQIALRVTHWLLETLPAADSDLSDEAKLRLGQHIAADRLERLYFATNRAWQETSQVKFANLSIRALTALSKLPAIPGTLEALAADAILGPLPDDTNSLYTTNRPNSDPVPPTLDIGPGTLNLNPPLRACSPSPPSVPKAGPQPPVESTTTPSSLKPSNNLPPTTSAARAAFFSTAHPPASTDEGAVVRGSPDPAPILEFKITPEKLGFTTQKNLSRKDRRRRRLALAKK